MNYKKKALAYIMSSIIVLSCAACSAGNSGNAIGSIANLKDETSTAITNDDGKQTEQQTAIEVNNTVSAPNAPVYDVDELGNLLDTRSVYLYNEGGLLYGKYEQCENITADGQYGVKYGDLTILSSSASEGIIQISTTNPKTFQKNGISLDKRYEELVAILGEPELGGPEQGIYWWTFVYDGYSLSVKSNDPSEAPYEIIIHY